MSSLEQARVLVTALEREAYGTDEITVLYPEGERGRGVKKALDRQEVQGRGALVGASVGGIVGLVVGLIVSGGWLAWSALRPLIDLGYVGSGFLGLTTGILVGSILGMAFGKSKRPQHDGRNADNILVAVRARSDERLHHAQEIFVAHGAANVATRMQ